MAVGHSRERESTVNPGRRNLAVFLLFQLRHGRGEIHINVPRSQRVDLHFLPHTSAVGVFKTIQNGARMFRCWVELFNKCPVHPPDTNIIDPSNIGDNVIAAQLLGRV
jgi:hypothetical protein